MASESPVVSVRIARRSEDCPFTNPSVTFELRAGETIWLRGASGAGKSFCCMHLAGLATLPGASVEAEWDPSIPIAQRIGFLFQKGVLLDSLNLAENIALALRASGEPHPQAAIDGMLEAVGLSGATDGVKMPGQLSGGMLRRAALAQILAQRKRLIILDEPFVGLDPPVAVEVVKLIRSVASARGVAMVLVSHLEPLAKELGPSRQIHLERARPEDCTALARPTRLSRLPFAARTLSRLKDYLFYSMPLIVCAFGATGAAVSMLLADMLRRVDIVAIVAGFLQKYLKGNPALPMVLSLVDRIVKANEAEAKRKLYAMALGSVFTIELGPLLTALLLAGRIGGSYAGDVSMMAATNQIDLLAILGVPALMWTFAPSLLAALIAAPILTAVGTAVALCVGGFVGGPSGFDLIDTEYYWSEVRETTFKRHPGAHLLKWAPLVNMYRSIGFMLATMVIAQVCARWQKRAQPRHVPLIITSAVVLSCLAVLLLDWGFSQMYVRLDDTHLVAATDPSALYQEEGGADDPNLEANLEASPEEQQAAYADYYASTEYTSSGAPAPEDAAPSYTTDELDVDGDNDEL
uniref:ABC transporter domain-containing protein n=1 Tax=Haptolina brevifila TaxID=156173 RepID=A0A7S2MYS5_9EUKA|mmetsp:Transcript_62127/g.122795  ORF Transcript_62127/g.122795 Transcript_62127/m.122795 type:complete len:579 (+) Transcript_62127:81-1817(+)|eukprot:CAMPEP_0174722500 /NCGR_PEP_ID=MMETSP1094-20130205/38621_1 /TAXON_ID=156173 /ORGANISM="Chrysochromulina brevifilum, Strain UTEX LB 985" /LENGTH=578 /DNA_ID=CAMNT_0015923373 /DNA_START=80 /DNA_END=1816 /DNA_ORIENTATION=+